MEEILPRVYVDGAHNSDGIRAFLETVERDGFTDRHLLFGVMQDKDYGLINHNNSFISPTRYREPAI